MTFVILLYGIFSDGFGIRGVSRSISFLDQRSHRAVTLSGRTLFAGLSPSKILPGAESYFFSREFTPFRAYSDKVGAHLFHINLDRGVEVSGAALPSRTLTHFVTLSQKTARERLRFQKIDGGGFLCLSESGFQMDSTQAFFLRDLLGNYYQSDQRGKFSGISEADWEKSRAVLRDRFTNWRTPSHDFDHYLALDPAMGTTLLQSWVERQIPLKLEPGSYAGFVDDIPSRDRFGLDVTESRSAHFVYGLLAKEDFVD